MLKRKFLVHCIEDLILVNLGSANEKFAREPTKKVNQSDTNWLFNRIKPIYIQYMEYYRRRIF